MERYEMKFGLEVRRQGDRIHTDTKRFPTKL